MSQARYVLAVLIREKMMNECAEKQSLTTMIVRVWETNHETCE